MVVWLMSFSVKRAYDVMFCLQSSVFKVKNVNVEVDMLKFSVRDSKHDFLYKMFKPLVTGLIKKQIQKPIKDPVTTGMEYIEGQLVGVGDFMDTAKATEGEKVL